MNGKIFIPVSMYLNLLRRILQDIHEKKDISVVFEDVDIHKSFVEVIKDETLTLTIMIHKGILFQAIIVIHYHQINLSTKY